MADQNAVDAQNPVNRIEYSEKYMDDEYEYR